jgi:hypothetical protein
MMEVPKFDLNETTEKDIAILEELTKIFKHFTGLEHLHSFFKMIDPLDLEE